MEKLITVGRRKTAVARVYLTKGTGKITVNGREAKEYFKSISLMYKINQPFQVTSTVGQYDVVANIRGGGITGQAEALQLGIARNLVALDEKYKPLLRENSLLTRDPRRVERKKPGRKKARKRFQFSKR